MIVDLVITKEGVRAFLVHFRGPTPTGGRLFKFSKFFNDIEFEDGKLISFPEEEKEFYTALGNDFLALLKEFDEYKEFFLISWLREINSFFQEDSLTISQLEMDKASIDKFELPKIKKGLTSLTINLTGLNEDALNELLEKIKRTPLFSLHLTGTPQVSSETIQAFLDALPSVSLFKLSYDDCDKDMAKQQSYKNKLMQYLNVDTRGNIWQALIDKWMMTPSEASDAGPQAFMYLKPNYRYEVYLEWLEYQHGKQKKHEHEKFYDEERGGRWGSSFEFYQVINSSVAGMGDLFFENMLKNLGDISTKYRHFYINHILSIGQIKSLAKAIEKDQSIAFAEVTLFVNVNLIKTLEFSQLLACLNKMGIETLQLAFPSEEWGDQYREERNAALVALEHQFNYLVKLGRYPQFNNDLMTCEESQISDFQVRVIKNLQKLNCHRLQLLMAGDSELLEIEQHVSVEDDRDLEKKVNPFATKIKLKELIKIPKLGEDPFFHNLIPLEVVVVEEIEEEIEEELQEYATEQITEFSEQILEQEQFERYEGELINYSKFSAQPFYGKLGHGRSNIHSIYDLVSKELFANLPHGIKYVTPEAAEELTCQLGVYATFNRPPPHFFLKKTPQGELVLDYDFYRCAVTNSIFTPVSYFVVSKFTRIMSQTNLSLKLKFDMADAKNVINNDDIFDILCGKEFTLERLHTLWVRYGRKGSQLFFDELNKLDETEPGLSVFICKLTWSNRSTHPVKR